MHMDIKSLESMSKEELLRYIEEYASEALIISDETANFRVNYRSLLEAASDIIFVLDTNGNLITGTRLGPDFPLQGKRGAGQALHQLYPPARGQEGQHGL
jgi:hypothetical protein